jgi:hypothetical protein
MVEKLETTSTVLAELATAELVNLAQQQATAGRKPDDAILTELKTRYAWSGCPDDDSALIARLDQSVLLPLFNGRTQLPPRIRKISGVETSPPPRYYQKLQEKNGMSSVTLSLKKLRDELNDEQIKFLNSFWKHFLDTGSWPLRLDIHRKYTKEKTVLCLRSLGGNPKFAGHIVHEDQAQAPIYKLTLVGILLTKNGEQYERWLIRLLEFFRRKFYQQKNGNRTPDFDEIQIAKALKLSDKKLAVMGELTRSMGIFQTQSHGHTVGHNWKINLPQNIDEVPPTGPLNVYFEQELLKYVKNPRWVFAEDGYAHSPGVSSSTILDNHLAQIYPTTPTDSENGRAESVKIFVSHSSYDKDLMDALTDLLKGAFALPAKEILCTSVAGHKLPGGADTEEALLDLLRNAKLLIGVLTPTSLASSYVLFELGARWGLKRPLISLVACGTRMENLKEPLRSKNALNGADEDDVHQLIEDVAKYLGQNSEPPSAFNKKINHFVSLARQSKPAE